jgi:hypothetical protein
MTPRWFPAALGLFLLSSAGCGGSRADYSQLGLVNARGKVTLDGQPLAGAVVTFDAPDGQFSYGLTDSGGNYALQIDSQQRGVTPGEKTVRISTTRKILGLNTGDGGEEGDPDEKPRDAEKVPDKYHKDSQLKITVSSDKTQYDFDLTSN